MALLNIQKILGISDFPLLQKTFGEACIGGCAVLSGGNLGRLLAVVEGNFGGKLKGRSVKTKEN